MNDKYNLKRFLAAQTGSYATALAEIKCGGKRSHWMWYVFPQIAGLGASPTARFYAISSIDEAKAYLAHPLLGERLRTCAEALQELTETTAEVVFGRTDALKLGSSLTLFIAAGGGSVFRTMLQRWFDNEADEATLRLSSV